MKLDLTALKICLAEESQVVAAYLFGSTARVEPVVNVQNILKVRV